MTRTLISSTQLKRGRVLYWTLLAVVVTVFTVVFIGPLYWMVTSALKSAQEVAQIEKQFAQHHRHAPHDHDGHGAYHDAIFT